MVEGGDYFVEVSGMHVTHRHMVCSGQCVLEGARDDYSGVAAVYRLVWVEHFEQHS